MTARALGALVLLISTVKAQGQFPLAGKARTIAGHLEGNVPEDPGKIEITARSPRAGKAVQQLVAP